MKKYFSLMLLLATICFALPSCSDDEDEPKPTPALAQTNYSLYAGQSTPLKGTSLDGLIWVGNRYVADIDNEGVLHANKVGYTRMYSDDIIIDGHFGLIYVEVAPKVTKYSEPLLYRQYVGENIEYSNGYIKNMATGVKADMWGVMQGFISYYVEKCGLPWTTYKIDKNTLIFKTDKEASPYVGYVFNDNAELIGVGTYINPLKAESLPEFLDERYLIYDVDMNNYTADFAHAVGDENDPEVDYVGRMQYSSSIGLIIIAYMPIDSGSKSKSHSTVEFNETFVALEKVL